MFARLRHRSFIRGDHEEREIDTAGAREHGAHERLVAGHVHDSDDLTVGKLQWREAEIDRDAAAFFFRKTIRVDASERVDEGGLAVIDVSGGTEDHAGAGASIRSPAGRPDKLVLSHRSNARNARSSCR